MAEMALNESQKNVVRRYVETWRRWRPGIRGFRTLETDMENRLEVIVYGIAVDDMPGRQVIAADTKDDEFHAAIFRGDDDAVPDMTAQQVQPARRYILSSEGAMPARTWRLPTPGIDAGVVALRRTATQR
jgi:hypothetical protein